MKSGTEIGMGLYIKTNANGNSSISFNLSIDPNRCMSIYIYVKRYVVVVLNVKICCIGSQ